MERLKPDIRVERIIEYIQTSVDQYTEDSEVQWSVVLDTDNWTQGQLFASQTSELTHRLPLLDVGVRMRYDGKVMISYNGVWVPLEDWVVPVD